MTKRKASYCPYCGAALEPRTFEGRERTFCPDCAEFVFQNPVPCGDVVVLDGDRVLLVERAFGPDEGKWITPGGVLEVDESARLGAARELEEETGLAVDPDALDLARTGFEMDDPEDGSILTICFAVERERTTGSVRVGDEPADARFWDLDAVRAGDVPTRAIDRRRIAAAYRVLRGGEIGL